MLEWSTLRASERWICAFFAVVITAMVLSLLLARSLAMHDRLTGLAFCLGMTDILLNHAWLRARAQALSWAAQPVACRRLFVAAVLLQVGHVLVGTAFAQAPQTAAARYTAATDLRPYVEQRASDPGAGTYAQAYWARWECSYDAGIARRIQREQSPASGSRQGQAMERLLQRCRHLSDADTHVVRQIQDLREGQARGDRLFSAFSGSEENWFSLHDPNELARAFAFLTPNEDARLVWMVSQNLARVAAGQRLAVQGRVPTRDEGRALHAAFLIAACDLNVDCGPSHRWMQVWCIQNAECDDPSIEAYWRRLDQKPDRHPMNWPMINDYRRIITLAQRTGDLSAFRLQPVN